MLSSGHACVLQYSLLHLTGYELSLEDLKQFRQWGSRTPGHPERGHTPGIEVTTGPLGQGFANAVGMAIAERFLAERFNRPGQEIVDHHIYAICSDGDMMEGISQEAASIAGHFGLGKLVVCYDDNHITIDGTTSISFDGENHAARLEADGWHVQRVEDSEDLDALRGGAGGGRATKPSARRSSRSARTSPTRRRTRSTPPSRTASALGEEEVRATKEVMGFDPDAHFWVDERVYEHMSLRDCGAQAQRRVAGALRGLARGAPRSWPRTGTSPGRDGCATAGARRCRASRPARSSPRARPGRRRWRPSARSRRR